MKKGAMKIRPINEVLYGLILPLSIPSRALSFACLLEIVGGMGGLWSRFLVDVEDEVVRKFEVSDLAV